MEALPPEGTDREFSELAQFEIDARSVQLLERDFCARHVVVVLGRVDPKDREPVTVGMLSPGRRSLVAQVEAALRRPVRAVRLNSWEIQRALDEGFGGTGADRGRATLLLVGRERTRDDLERDELFEHFVVGEIHRAHAALAEQALYAIALREHLTGLERGGQRLAAGRGAR